MKKDVDDEEEAKASGKKYVRGADRGQYRVLVVPKDEEEKEVIDGNMANANKLEVLVATERVKADNRTLTLLALQQAVENLSLGLPVTEATRRKCEKDDYALYGIEIGTKVESNGMEGEIIAANMDESDGFNKFAVRWDREHVSIAQYSTCDVLRDAVERQGVISVEDDEKRFGVFLRAVLCMVLVHVHDFVTHNKELKRMYPVVALDEDERDGVREIRKYAWGETERAAAADTLNPIELALLASDAGLVQELEKEESCLKAMGLDSKDVTVSSLISLDSKFHPTHISLVNHFVRGAQAAWRLGRPISLESCMAPISTNELPRGIKVDGLESDRTIYPTGTKGAENCGLATRAVLARARVEGGSSHWLSHYPLFRLFDLSRPVGLGKISPTSENTGKVCPTRRHLDAYTRTARLSKTLDRDLEVFALMDKEYEPVAQAKKVKAEIHENGLARHGDGSKCDKGRMLAVDDEAADEAYKRMEDMMVRNSIEPVMSRLPDWDTTTRMCVDVLKREPRKFGKRENEKHFCPKDKRVEIECTVDAMIEGGMTTTILSALSCALVVTDSVTTACLRNEDTLGSDAKDVHIVERKDANDKDVDVLRAILPPEFKNRESLNSTTLGCAVNHSKSDVVKDAYAVMMVIGRPIMRKLLAKELAEEQQRLKKEGKSNKVINAAAKKYRLAEKVGPFNKNGKCYGNKELYELFKYVGKRALGLPFFGPNILRTVHVTRVVKYCIKNGIDSNHPDVVRLFALARHGEHERKRSYDSLKADVVNDTGVFGRSMMGVNSSVGDERTPTTQPEHAFEGMDGLPGMAAFETMPEYESGSQVLPFHTSEVNARLLTRVEKYHEREVAELKEKIRRYEVDGSSGAANKRVAPVAPVASGGVENKKKIQKVEMTPGQKAKSELIRDMHKLFVRVSNEVLPDPSVKAARYSPPVEERGRSNSLEYELKCGNTKPTTVFAACVKDKLESVDNELCKRFFAEFKSKRVLKHFWDAIDPECWPTWFD